MNDMETNVALAFAITPFLLIAYVAVKKIIKKPAPKKTNVIKMKSYKGRRKTSKRRG